MDAKRLPTADLAQLGGALVVLISLFLPWYSTDDKIPTANIDGHTGDISGWTAHPVLRWLLVVAFLAGLWSAVQTLNSTEPTQGFRRGETSTVVAAVIVGLVLIQGFLARPGEPDGAINLGIGWVVALLGSLVALGAAISRIPAATRKPPGV
jgi:hypothetical protein